MPRQFCLRDHNVCCHNMLSLRIRIGAIPLKPYPQNMGGTPVAQWVELWSVDLEFPYLRSDEGINLYTQPFIITFSLS